MKPAYTRKGRGPVLVLVHGYLGGGKIWADQLAAFSARHDVICPDLAGFGDSAHLTAPDSITGHAQDVLRMLDALGSKLSRFWGIRWGAWWFRKWCGLPRTVSPHWFCMAPGRKGFCRAGLKRLRNRA